MFGTEFEKELAEEFAIQRVPGSGNQWHSKLDLSGFSARWSLKSTEKNSISIKRETIDEAIRACFGSSGAMEIPVWAFRIGDREHDMVMLRKEDFKMLQAGEIKIIGEDIPAQIGQKRARAKTPFLLREDE